MSAMGFINRLLGRKQSQLPPFDFARNRYPAKKTWPPNLRELTEKQQFHFERKFKRRTRLKSIKPTWNKWTKIVQWSMISFIVVHGVFFYDFANDPMNPTPGKQPFQGLRDRMNLKTMQSWKAIALWSRRKSLWRLGLTADVDRAKENPTDDDLHHDVDRKASKELSERRKLVGKVNALGAETMAIDYFASNEIDA
ncbi:hypothetical protein E8E12_009642 [Didymella heteroderae]|uniref:Uncharacterized protein n=1 Tax=Didymella heteroderae TaxID=1769908 RepID=A0A9P4X1Q8_9PLEO|nr:hypothetical protein E8E12_009642 [Didymella heteroderae]